MRLSSIIVKNRGKMPRALRINSRINQSPVGQEEANSQGLAILVSARPPTGDSYYIKNRSKCLKYAKKYYQKNKKLILRKSIKHRKRYHLSRTLANIKQRCNYIKDKKYIYYGGKGIKCLLNLKDLRYLWFRDKAYILKQPSIHRKNNQENYTIDNCQFIEMSVNRTHRGSYGAFSF